MKRFVPVLTWLVCLLLAAAALAGGSPTTLVTPPRRQLAPQQVLEFWTPERLRAARPMDLPRIDRPLVPFQGETTGDDPPLLGGELGFYPPYVPEGGLVAGPPDVGGGEGGLDPQTFMPCPASSWSGWYDARNLEYPNSVMGALFFRTADGSLARCTASAVGPNIILTAGHCVMDYGAWHSDWLFVPGYFLGTAPFGYWTGYGPTTFGGWANDRDWRFDVGMLKIYQAAPGVFKFSGWLGLAWGGSPAGNAWSQYGYPAEFPFDGEVLYSVYSGYGYGIGEPFGAQWMGVGSDMTGGSSGGPWALWLMDGSFPAPYANSVNSGVFLDCGQTMHGPYFGTWVKELYDFTAAQ